MKSLVIIGNWKSNKTNVETKEWVDQLEGHVSQLTKSTHTIVLCAPYTALYVLKQEVSRLHLPIQIGAQDLSPFVDGAYTGAVSARMVSELAQYVIIGHSERRLYFKETDEELAKKVERAKTEGLKVVFCVPDDTALVPSGVDIIGYEPTWAIGTGKTDTPQNAGSVIVSIKKRSGVSQAVYGGSVTADNVSSFVQEPAIDGVLLGGASLNPEKFVALVAAASSVQ